LASCQVPFTGAGAVRISLANGVAHSVGKVALTAGTDHVRIQLLRNGNIVPQGGQDYQDVVFANQTVTIDQLAPGTGYKILVSAGTATSSGFFQVKDYGATDPFEITAGVESAVSVSAPDTPAKLVTSGSRGAATVVSGSLYALFGKSLKSSADGSTFNTVGTLTDITTGWSGTPLINSFSTGLDTSGTEQLWANTSDGISIFSGTSFPTPRIQGENDSSGNPTYTNDNVLFSGSVQVTNDIVATSDPNYGKKYDLHLYGGDGISAGARFVTEGAPSSTDAVWYSVNGKLDSLPSSLTDVLGKSNLFLGYAKTDNFAYISTSLGIYRISKKMVTDGKNSYLQFFDPDYPLGDPLDENHHKVLLGLADKDAKAQAVATVLNSSTVTSTTKALVFIGANKGLFFADADKSTGVFTDGQATSYTVQYTDTDAKGDALYRDATGSNPTVYAKERDSNGNPVQVNGVDQYLVFDTTNRVTTGTAEYTIAGAGLVKDRVSKTISDDFTATIVSGTEGKSINKVVSTLSGADVYTAAYASNTRELVFLKNSSVLKVVPLFAGLPSGRLDLVWFAPSAGGLMLVASGDDGIVTIDPTAF
jgi:hypothetical protein